MSDSGDSQPAGSDERLKQSTPDWSQVSFRGTTTPLERRWWTRRRVKEILRLVGLGF